MTLVVNNFFQGFLKQQILIESDKQVESTEENKFKSILFVCFGWIRGQSWLFLFLVCPVQHILIQFAFWKAKIFKFREKSYGYGSSKK